VKINPEKSAKDLPTVKEASQPSDAIDAFAPPPVQIQAPIE
jgi:hypothetical protein